MNLNSAVPIAVAVTAFALQLSAQNAVAPAPPQAPAPRARPAAYPSRPPADPAALERGKALYGVNCNFCHGSDARGGEGGPNLLRSQLVLNDKNGETIRPVIQNGRPDMGMPKFPFTMAQISDIAAYLHDFRVGGYDISRMVPLSIVVGDPKAGAAYFASTCADCHSVTGNLKGIATKYANPKSLQNAFVMPRGGRAGGTPTTVTVLTESGEKVEGRLGRIDDFVVTLVQTDGTQRSFLRDGDAPRVELHDPVQPHKDLLSRYTDKDIHDLTAYLVTVK